jgi:hypothetical protein
MPEAILDFHQIITWNDFHSECKRGFGFPDFYGCNMNAWIDCLTYMTDGGDGMSRFMLDHNEILTIRVINCQKLSSIQEEILDTLIECTGFVNERYKANGDLERLRVQSEKAP